MVFSLSKSARIDRQAPRSGVRNLAQVLALALMLVPVAACSSLDFFSKKDDTLAEDSADKIYNEGLYFLNEKKEYKEAIKRFDEVDRQHPYSEFARKALIMSAFSAYEAKNYDDCITTAKRYLALHPGTPDAAYAQYLIGSADFERLPDATRDQARTEKAIASLEEVVRKYPNTEYAVSAKRKIDVARDQLAGKEMTVGRYYMENRNFTGAINRFKVVVTQYQTTRHVEEALMRLTEAYMSLGIVGEAQTAAALLGHNFPDSRWYQDAYKLVKNGGLEPVENQGSWMSKAFKKLGVG